MGDIGAVVLAAGGSSRLGQPKQLLIFSNGETLVHSAVRAAREGGCAKVCVVTGAVHEEVAKAVADLNPMIVRNREWSRGIGSSIRLGVAELSDVFAIVLLTCDQPALDAEIVRALITRYQQTKPAIIASHYANTLGTPALFSRPYFAALQSLPDKNGAKSLIEMNRGRVEHVDFPDGRFDIDSPLDLRTWHRTLRHRNFGAGKATPRSNQGRNNLLAFNSRSATATLG
jgi:molybdenum cofactor cytidylyltransferase